MRPDYLRVDDYLRDIAAASALGAALELGVIDSLARPGSCAQVAERASLDRGAIDLLVGLLKNGGVLERNGDELRLTEGFSTVLRHRDLLEAKLDLVKAVSIDIGGRFTELLAEPERFFRESELFRLFSYERCFDATPANVEATRRWVRITTALTRHEAPSCLTMVDLRVHRRMLDVGGNSGEFARQACAANPDLHATVLDLPVVCQIGEEHVAMAPEASRIRFLRTRGSDEEFPGGFDLVSFKSMLHDWPEADSRRFLARAYRALVPGGTLLIFERSAIDVAATAVPYSMLPLLLFFRSYREPEAYRAMVSAAGFRNVQVRRVDLDMPFLLLTAER